LKIFNRWKFHPLLPYLLGCKVTDLQAFVKDSHPTSIVVREIWWQSGDQDAMMLNVDDSALTNPKKSGFRV
jgi:hypothetical protein